MTALLCSALCACGPKEIGQGLAAENLEYGHFATTAEDMRLPMTGASNTQRLLYYCNRPEVMQQMLEWRMSQARRLAGAKPSPEDPAYRAMPRQRSPFRQ